MKVRADFVTNSSSSSYTLVVGMTPKDLIEMLISESVVWDNPLVCISEANRDLETAKKDLADFKKSKSKTKLSFLSSLYMNSIVRYTERKEKYEALKTAFMKNRKRTLPKLVLEQLKDQGLDVKFAPSSVTLKGSNTMWNGLTDIHPVLSTILCYCAIMRIDVFFENIMDNDR